ncbi:MAG: hypothetical protein COW76_01975, partial [Shewanella sp. CG18_big_fil_WC_8_21_14_2_50_42_11]
KQTQEVLTKQLAQLALKQVLVKRKNPVLVIRNSYLRVQVKVLALHQGLVFLIRQLITKGI